MAAPTHVISIRIKRSLSFPYKRQWLRDIIATALGEENIEGPVEAGCAIIDDESIRKLNLRYRGIDAPTDVLSFALMDGPDCDGGVRFPVAQGNPVELGDIIISYPRAAAQAKSLGHSVEDELTLLLVHGTLHLLGYDHQEEGEAKEMSGREKAILKKLHGAGGSR